MYKAYKDVADSTYLICIQKGDMYYSKWVRTRNLNNFINLTVLTEGDLNLDLQRLISSLLNGVYSNERISFVAESESLEELKKLVQMYELLEE